MRGARGSFPAAFHQSHNLPKAVDSLWDHQYPQSRGQEKHHRKKENIFGKFQRGKSAGNSHSDPMLIEVLRGQSAPRPPIWLMRQAGRYLPEYRALRAKAGQLPRPVLPAGMGCRDHAAADPSLWFRRRDPVRRYPDRTGCARAESGLRGGPGPAPRRDAAGALLKVLTRQDRHKFAQHLRNRGARPRRTAPGKGADRVLRRALDRCDLHDRRPNHEGPTPARLAAFRDPENFARLIDCVADCLGRLSPAQIGAGAQAVQIFDSWAGVLPDDQFGRWCDRPDGRMVRRLAGTAPRRPVIGFPRGAGDASERLCRRNRRRCGRLRYLDAARRYAGARRRARRCKAISIRFCLSPAGPCSNRAFRTFCAALEDVPHVFNLGHGILPATPVEHVARLVELVRS